MLRSAGGVGLQQAGLLETMEEQTPPGLQDLVSPATPPTPTIPKLNGTVGFPVTVSGDDSIASTATVNPFQEQFTGFGKTLGGFGEQLGGFGEQLGGLGEQMTGYQDALGSFNEQIGGMGKQFETVNNKLDSLEKGLASLQQFQPQQSYNPYTSMMGMFNPYSGFSYGRRFG